MTYLDDQPDGSN
jgi:hypothetical protein